MPNSTQTNVATAPRSAEEIEHIIVMERLHRYHHGLPCGALALRRHLREEISLRPLPSVGRIRQILSQYGLTYGRTGWYAGEELNWRMTSARVPEARRKHFSITDDSHQ